MSNKARKGAQDLALIPPKTGLHISKILAVICVFEMNFSDKLAYLTYDFDEKEYRRLTKAERRKRRRATPKYRNLHATRER